MAAISAPHDEANLGIGGLPSVIGGPGSDFNASGLPGAFWPM
jgi:hypothetical protein